MEEEKTDEKSRLIKELNDASNHLNGVRESLYWFKGEFPKKISRLININNDEGEQEKISNYSVMVSAAYFRVETALKDLTSLFPYDYDKSNED